MHVTTHQPWGLGDTGEAQLTGAIPEITGDSVQGQVMLAGQGGGRRQGTEAQSCFKVSESDSHSPGVSMISAPHFPFWDLDSHQLNVTELVLLKPHPPGSPVTSRSYRLPPTHPTPPSPAAPASKLLSN